MVAWSAAMEAGMSKTAGVVAQAVQAARMVKGDGDRNVRDGESLRNVFPLSSLSNSASPCCFLVLLICLAGQVSKGGEGTGSDRGGGGSTMVPGGVAMF
jgi:hypothetical protein